MSFRPDSSQHYREDAAEKPASPPDRSPQAPLSGHTLSNPASVSLHGAEDAPTNPASSPEQASQDEARAARIAIMQQTGTASAPAAPAKSDTLAVKPPQPPFPPITITSPFSSPAQPQPSSVPVLTESNASTPPDASTGLNFHLNHPAPPEPQTLPDADPAATQPASSIEAPPPSPRSAEAADLQAVVVEALFAAKIHNSAAEQLEETTWTLADGELRIQTSLSKQMMTTIFRPDVEAIVKGALRTKGVTGLKISFIAGTPESKSKTPRKPRTGSAQAKALEHPTVQAAQRLFNAEVTNVVDLRRD